ncbi:MAG: AAA family ATPase [Leptospiraceae bacterium]|nr:AAA family ATPase [Leptospiraceae bacterium]
MNLSKDHINEISVEGFKKFKKVVLDDIGQFNLIVGDNNVGKTTLLEILLIDYNLENYVYNLLNALNYKGVLSNVRFLRNPDIMDYLKLYFNKDLAEKKIVFQIRKGDESDVISVKIIENISKFTEQEREHLELYEGKNFAARRNKKRYEKSNYEGFSQKEGYIALYRNDEIETIISDFDYDPESPFTYYTPFIPFSRGYNIILADYFSKYIIEEDKTIKELFIKNLKAFIPDLEDIAISFKITTSDDRLPIIYIFEKSTKSPFPLSMMGEGANKLFRILLEIMICRGKRLMIDEIDTGVHYSRFKDFWKIIIKSAILNDVQIFATTHNIECLKYFKEALEEKEMLEFRDRARNFSIREIQDRQLSVFKYSFEEFEHAINQDINIR